LGDHYDDGQALSELYPHILFYQVAGNCDRYRCPPGAPEALRVSFGGVATFAVHGHNQHVKMGLGGLLADARRAGVSLVLYGHTHSADCHQEPDGLWVMNPGASGHYGGSAGLIEAENGRIKKIGLLSQTDLEAFSTD